MLKSDLNELKFRQDFIRNLEIERTNLGFTQQEMANWLDVSLSAYKRIVAGDVGVRGLYIMAVLYYLTGKFCFEYLEVHDSTMDICRKIRHLSNEDKVLVNDLIDRLIHNTNQNQ